MIMRHYGCDYCYFVVLNYTGAIDSVLLSVQDFGPRGYRDINETLGLWIKSGSGLLGFIVVYMIYVHMIRGYDYVSHF
jgi:hypothetical protein